MCERNRTSSAVMFLPAGSATANSVTWNPNLSSPAQYEVYAKWTAHANRASDATYTVHHALGSTSIAVDQRASGGTWNPLGTYDLDSASTIVLTDAADGYVIADAIRLVQVGAPPPAGPAGIFYVHADHLGTPKVVTDAAQGIAWAADYLPYGQAQVTAEAVRLNVRFPGQYFDAETGLHYNYFRDYDSAAGRYVESDPMGLLDGPNTYSYVRGNPLTFVDPRGLQIAVPVPLPPPPGASPGQGTQPREPAPFWPKPIRDLFDNIERSENASVDDIIAAAPVPAFPGVNDLAQDCTPGRKLVEPATARAFRGGTSVQQEYHCSCGLITRHTIVKDGLIVHDHFRPGPAKKGGGD
jgi:RHS repeat-associated protein